MDIGKRLKELREEKGYTQEFVAKKLGITRQAYSRYETGQRTVGPESFLILAELYSVTVDYLIGYTDEFGNKNK